MTKSELIERLSGQFPALSAADVRISVDHILDAISGALASEQRIEIRGFGSFTVHYRAPRTGRNPKTGAQVFVPSKAAPHFKPGKIMKEMGVSTRQAG